jgi:hypothetical protein
MSFNLPSESLVLPLSAVISAQIFSPNNHPLLACIRHDGNNLIMKKGFMTDLMIKTNETAEPISASYRKTISISKLTKLKTIIEISVALRNQA